MVFLPQALKILVEFLKELPFQTQKLLFSSTTTAKLTCEYTPTNFFFSIHLKSFYDYKCVYKYLSIP